MRRCWILFTFGVCAALLMVQLASADSALRINQAKTLATLNESSATIHIELAIDNSTANSVAAHIKMELLDTANGLRDVAEGDAVIAPGLHLAPFDLSFGEVKEDLLWGRLRYEITGGAQRLVGVLALSAITPEMFELRAAAPFAVSGSKPYRVRVISVHPITAQPVGGVKLTGEITISEGQKEKLLQAVGVTNPEGYATLEFTLPENIDRQNLGLKITGEHLGLVQEVESDIQNSSQKQFLINSDKLIYQPGQTLHVRALLFDAERRALADQNVTLKILDEENIVVYRAALKTSRFGIASSDWRIPANLRLGEYEIRFRADDEVEETWQARHVVRISRYDLPNFTVQAKPDRTYYLANQKPQVEVRGDYLFGQALHSGRVKIVRETARHWNYRDQKYDIEEEDEQTGTLDKDGRFVATLDVSKVREDLKQRPYQRFQDVSFTAYLTDLTTNRTEQRRFDVRVTTAPIHLYLIEGRPQSRDFPAQFYLATFYADGAPAPCEVAINEVIEGQSEERSLEKPLLKVKTNRYGVAKVNRLFIGDLRETHANATLHFSARDRNGRSGEYKDDLRFKPGAAVRLNTDKPLYGAGESLRVQIEASKAIATLFVEVHAIKNWQPLFSQVAQLVNGCATLTIPYAETFKGELIVSAYTNFGKEVSEYEYPADSRRVLYPQDDELKVNVTMSQTLYRPGEEASVAMRVQAQGAGVESALGLTVFDKAVDERARTDNESLSRYNYFVRYQRQFTNAESISGINRRVLNQLDLSKPLPPDLRLVAEILLGNNQYLWRNLMNAGYATEHQRTYKRITVAQFQPVLAALDRRYKKTGEFPRNGTELRRELQVFNLDIDALRDPLGLPYRDQYSIDRDEKTVTFISAGADKKFGSDDDFAVASMSWKYFKPVGEIVDRALKNYHQRTGLYIANRKTLQAELRREGVELQRLRDPWGKAYRVEFGVLQTTYTIAFVSSGAPRHFGERSKRKSRSDDFRVWTSAIDYTTEIKAKLNAAFNEHYRKAKSFPQNDAEFASAMKAEGIDVETLRDGWNQRLYATYKTQSRYADRVTIYSYAKYPEPAKQRNDITPVTQRINYLTLRSRGADNREGTADDFDVAAFSRIVAEQAAQAAQAAATGKSVFLPEGMGAIAGAMLDPQGAVIAGVNIMATNKATGMEYRATSDDQGRYTLDNLPAGFYEIKFKAQGFATTVITEVPVVAANVTEIDAELSPGGVSEALTVTVTATESLLQTTNASATTIETMHVESLPLNGRNYVEFVTRTGGAVDGGLSTPRLRDYFPETLLWQPEIITDAQGQAQLKFKLADNITTWKVAAIASTLDGRIAVAEREVRAFQPFFIEHDPPRILTAGDQLALPIVLRNYLDKAQTIKLELQPATWFETLGAAQQQCQLAAGEARRETFNIRATAFVKDGKQQVKAIGSEASDAVEKTVSVHPDGQEILQTASQIFGDAGNLEIHIPAAAINDSTTAELKIYPNLMAHVLESVEAIMQRPYGCGEQTISAAYPSLLALRHCQQQGDETSPLAVKARRYVQSGYERLLSYRNENGGFSYWGRDAADFALTTYALQFLVQASEFIAVDEAVLDAAQAWLLKHQQADGHWAALDWRQVEDPRRSLMLTAYVARVLAALLNQKAKPSASAPRQAKANTRQKDAESEKPVPSLRASTQRALAYLAQRVNEFDEPYLLASYALAAFDAREIAEAESAVERLPRLAHAEEGANYWALETNTPFYGWGLAGRIETTALAVRALATWQRIKDDAATRRNDDAAHQPRQETTDQPRQETTDQRSNDAKLQRDAAELINRGLLFLLKQKDRYGVWYSTQATVNALDALLAILSQREAKTASSANQTGATQAAEIFVNGRQVETVVMPNINQLTNPILLDVGKYLSTGSNLVEIRRPANAVQASAQLVETHYENWATSITKTPSQALRFAVHFDKTQAQTREEIVCQVAAERVGFRGYGMMIAEIGLPPGAEVDRASLELAMTKSNGEINQYDVLPDRVIVYLWPRAGGSQFAFKFRPRFAIAAQTAVSVLYDYYNAEARQVVAPVRFKVE
ncbi:MAG: carboxypeptidase regulatory-like domain-containing protein [Acidobacteria bacterium]|nr:carboxypeptidase regulatory-like domain-containing protein [Acidobacteriota bacterium]